MGSEKSVPDSQRIKRSGGGGLETPLQAGGTLNPWQRAWPWVVVLVLAFGLRLAHVSQIRGLAFFDTPVGDAASYDAWGQRLAAGDWLGSEVFYQAPAYPYFLGVVYKLIGRDLLWLRVVQAGLGACSCLMLGLAGAKFFSRRVGIVAGLLLAFYPPAIFFDGLIQKTSLALALIAGLLWRLGCVQRRQVWWGWLVVGMLLALIGLTRENALVLLLVVGVWMWAGFRGRSVRSRVGWSAALVCGMAVVLLPVVVRNYRVSGELVLTTTQAGPNFYIGNHAGATGRYTPLVRGHETPQFERTDAIELAEQAEGRKLTGREVSRYWLSKSWGYIRSEPLGWLALLGKKALMTFNAYEITDVEGYSLYRDAVPLIGVLGGVWHFGVLCPLAAVGVWGWKKGRSQETGVRSQEDGGRGFAQEHGAANGTVVGSSVAAGWKPAVHGSSGVWLLLGMLVALAGSVTIFYVFARYRFPLVPVLGLFAAVGLVWIVDRLRGRAYGALVVPAVLLVVAGVACNVRVNPERELDGMAYANLAAVLGQRGDVEAAVRVLEVAVEVNPQSPEIQYNLGLANSLLGRYGVAVEHLEEAKRLDAGLVEVDYLLGVAYESMGDRDMALAAYRRALEANPRDTEARAGIERVSD